MVAKNTGKTLKMVRDDGDDRQSTHPLLSGGPLNVKYEFMEMHFHWGDNVSGHGSEHTIDGKG